ncbi:MAG: hypothetical protein L6R40_004702 [Gallowayella cf. fulva]|nr:MAG: hypothetical protein L6R40_004702 [Xanthomendoza cf. fulva]
MQRQLTRHSLQPLSIRFSGCPDPTGDRQVNLGQPEVSTFQPRTGNVLPLHSKQQDALGAIANLITLSLLSWTTAAPKRYGRNLA